MKKNLKILAIIFSVVLNVVFIGSYSFHKVDRLHMTGHNGNHNRFLIKELNLSQEQLDVFDPIRKRFHAFIDQQGRAIRDKQLELIGLLAIKNPDRKAIDVKQKEIQAMQRQMQTRVIDHFIEESGIFTPEQREKFFGLIRKRIEKSEAPRPRWMPRGRSDSAKGCVK